MFYALSDFQHEESNSRLLFQRTEWSGEFLTEAPSREKSVSCGSANRLGESIIIPGQQTVLVVLNPVNQALLFDNFF